MKYLVIVCLFFSCRSQTQIVTSVHDGDTFYTNTGKTIRLAEIDSPELTQAYGMEARNYLASLILYKQVRIIKIGVDKYNRDVCKVYIGNTWVNKAVVEAGYAWAYKGLSSLNNAQIQARNAKKGMWINKYNQPPFKYRQYGTERNTIKRKNEYQWRTIRPSSYYRIR